MFGNGNENGSAAGFDITLRQPVSLVSYEETTAAGVKISQTKGGAIQRSCIDLFSALTQRCNGRGKICAEGDVQSKNSPHRSADGSRVIEIGSAFVEQNRKNPDFTSGSEHGAEVSGIANIGCQKDRFVCPGEKFTGLIIYCNPFMQKVKMF